MWAVYALGSAVFAALTTILAKIGIEAVPSNLGTAIRTLVVLALAWGMVFLTGEQQALSGISRKSLFFLVLSGLATGASWLCYYQALQLGPVSKVAPIDKLSVLFTLIFAFPCCMRPPAPSPSWGRCSSRRARWSWSFSLVFCKKEPLSVWDRGSFAVCF